MGMDVYGKAPIAESGKHFRNNVWSWRPLAVYCEVVAPALTDYEQWHFNDGAGLDAAQAVTLADMLEQELNSGATRRYAELWAAEIAAKPDEICKYCNGSGERDDAFHKGTCNACNGSGKKRPMEALYFFDTENVANWITFLRNCGGFEIC
jgi:hypothetical protein